MHDAQTIIHARCGTSALSKQSKTASNLNANLHDHCTYLYDVIDSFNEFSIMFMCASNK